MQINETLNKGLARELTIMIASKDMESRLVERLKSMKDRTRINGFRKGKVPVSHLRKIYGRQVMSEIIDRLVSSHSGKILKERGEKPAQRPQISMTKDEKEAQEILDGKKDLEFRVIYEVLPEFEIPALDQLKIKRPTVDISNEEIEEHALKVAESVRSWSEKKGKAAKGDRVCFDYLGKIDGKAFDGGQDRDAKLILGSGTFIPGFEEQLIGVRNNEEIIIQITFPEEYGARNLAGKDASFEVRITQVEKPGKLELNDEVAKKLGVESLNKLYDAIRNQLEGKYGSFIHARVKRQILDQLDEKIMMDLPRKMVEQEFDNIWNQMTGELERNNKTFEDENTTEEEARKEYGELAERRVRLGLILAAIGEKEKIDVSKEEMEKAVHAQMRQHPGQEKRILKYFQKNPDAIAGLRAPIYEEKVIDHIMTVAAIKDKKVSAEELVKEDDE